MGMVPSPRTLVGVGTAGLIRAVTLAGEQRLRRFGQMVELNGDATAAGGDGAKIEAVSMQTIFGDERGHGDGGGVVLNGRDDLAPSPLEVIQDFTEVDRK